MFGRERRDTRSQKRPRSRIDTSADNCDRPKGALVQKVFRHTRHGLDDKAGLVLRIDGFCRPRSFAGVSEGGDNGQPKTHRVGIVAKTVNSNCTSTDSPLRRSCAEIIIRQRDHALTRIHSKTGTPAAAFVRKSLRFLSRQRNAKAHLDP